MKRKVCLTLALMALALSLTSCSLLGGNKNQQEKPMASESESSQSSSADKSSEMPKDAKTVEGTINKIDTYLVLLTEDGEYQVMDYGEGVTVDEFMEGDKVTITYTGELGSETSTPVILAIAKAK